MTKSIAIAALCLACNSLPPPPAITVNSAMPDVVASAISTAREAWCAADVGWCPDLVSSGGADVMITDWRYVGHALGPGETVDETGWTGPAEHRDAWRIEVAPPFATQEDLPGILTHAFGHFCIDGHIADSALMRASTVGAIVPLVDEPARAAWLSACPR